MALRDVVNKNPAAATVVLMLVLAGSLWVIGRRVMKAPATTRFQYAYYYNLNTGDLYVAQSEPRPTHDATGVKAKVFSCGQCEDNASHFIGWLEKDEETPQQAIAPPKQEAPEGGPPMMAVNLNTTLIAAKPASGEPKWVSMNSPQGTVVMQAIRAQCQGGTADGASQPTACVPLKSEIPKR